MFHLCYSAVDENGDGIEKNLENGGDTEEEDEEEEEASKPKTMPSEDEVRVQIVTNVWIDHKG